MAYPIDPELRSQTLELLGGIWPQLPRALPRARSWGSDWLEVSTPFVAMVDGRIAAHVGVLEIPMCIDGRTRTVAGIHAVCSDPNQRGRGHVRSTLERALAWVDARYETAILWANDSEIYGRFGFVEREESIFVGPVQGGVASSLRTLSLDAPADVDFLRERLARRTPVCPRVAGHDPGWLALIDLALWSAGPSLAFIPELECVVVYTIRQRFVDLYDIIAERIPALSEIASRLGARIDTAVVYFSPDSLAAQLVAEPTPLADQLMTRGTWLADQRPFALSPLARC